MGVISDAAVSRGDLMHRIAELERRLLAVETSRRLEAATVGSGGLRLRGGRLLAEDASGRRVFEVTTDPAAIFMQPELVQDVVEAILTSPAGEALAAFAIGARTHAATVATQQTTTSFSFADLSTVGPTVSGVPISASGRAIVHVACLAEANTVGSSSSAVSGDMGFEITGATSRAPASHGFLSVGHFDSGNNASASLELGRTVLITGLNEGEHTFRAKYRRVQGSNPYPFANRTLVVTGL